MHIYYLYDCLRRGSLRRKVRGQGGKGTERAKKGGEKYLEKREMGKGKQRGIGEDLKRMRAMVRGKGEGVKNWNGGGVKGIREQRWWGSLRRKMRKVEGGRCRP